MVFGRVSFLLAADIQAPAESYLVNNAPVLASVVLKVPHHGSNTSTTAEFLRRVSPYLAVISVGAENQHRHPHPEVVERLGRALGDGGIYRTDQRGTIEFISDGSRLWIKTQR
jgi:competence protein ComEC